MPREKGKNRRGGRAYHVCSRAKLSPVTVETRLADRGGIGAGSRRRRGGVGAAGRRRGGIGAAGQRRGGGAAASGEERGRGSREREGIERFGPGGSMDGRGRHNTNGAPPLGAP